LDLTGLRKLAVRAVLIAIALVLLYQLWIFLHVVWWNWINPASSRFMDAGLERIQEKNPDAELKHKWVDYEKISPHLKRAIVAAEDANFLDHEGFDWDALQRAYEKNARRGRVVSGGSTISQQLAKNLFLSPDRTRIRKIQEAIITLMLENVMEKRRILEIYLNVIEWGDGVYGVEAAARHYFRTSAANLSPWQAAKLAAMVPNPRFYDEHRSTAWLERKTQVILVRMREADIP
jgi:monofunctional biosynthetic peptidoglycan transglycosylase